MSALPHTLRDTVPVPLIPEEYAELFDLKSWKKNRAILTEEVVLHWILAFVPMRTREFAADSLGGLLMVVQYILSIHSRFIEENSLLTLFTLLQILVPVGFYLAILLVCALGVSKLLNERIHHFRIVTVLGYYFLPLLVANLLSLQSRDWTSWLAWLVQLSATVSLAQSVATLTRDSGNGAILGSTVAAVAWKLHAKILPS